MKKRLVVVEIESFTHVCGDCSYRNSQFCTLFDYPLDSPHLSDNYLRLGDCKDAELRASGVA